MARFRFALPIWLLLSLAASPAFTESVHEAAVRGDLEAVRLLLMEKPALLDARDEKSETPLHHAIWNRHSDVAEFLIERGAEVDAPNNIDQTPLFYTAYKGLTTIARMLLERGADPGLRDRYGRSPLHYASREGSAGVVDLLLARNVDPDAQESRGNTLLCFAAGRGQCETARQLIEHGADIRLADEWHLTPIHKAVRGNHIEVVQLLIDNGANPEVLQHKGKTPLQDAVMFGYPDIVKILIQGGADINGRDEDGNTALCTAVYHGKGGMVDLLIASGVDVNARNHQGRTALHAAAIAGYPGIVDRLIAAGANVNIEDDDHRSATEYAMRYGHRGTAELLASRGGEADVGAETRYGPSPLLEKPPGENEAVVWYLGHSGWAVRTQDHLLIFDYWLTEFGGRDPEEPLLANGHINTSEIRDLDVCVFTSHNHRDHFDSTVLDWERSIHRVTYVFGWSAFDDPRYHCRTNEQEEIDIGPVRVGMIAADDGGAAFRVEVDGLVLYHGGDYVGDARADMEYLAGGRENIDIAFIETSEVYRDITIETIRRLRPRVMFPMHAGGSEYVYWAFRRTAEEMNLQTAVICAENRGDTFLYRNGGIVFEDSPAQTLLRSGGER